MLTSFPMRWILWLLSALLLVSGFGLPLRGIDTSMLPKPDPWRWLAVQRIQALLARSTQDHPHPVRVLFYGQSIIQQEWWVLVAQELRAQFPQANLIIENRAIGSFDATCLIRTAEVDVYPFRPDLIVFHCYGPYSPSKDWENLLRQFRTRTTADILLVGNHPLWDSEVTETLDPAQMKVPSESWLNYVYTPALARELGLCFPDNRSAWKSYLQASQRPVGSLLRDGVHFNLEGSELQFAALRPYLRTPRVVPELDPLNNERIRTVGVGETGVRWKDRRLRLPFVGNRVDVIGGGGPSVSCQVRIDGMPPTLLMSGRGHRRTSLWKGEVYPWPALLRVGHEVPLNLETWVLRVTEVDPQHPEYFRFAVTGTVTGDDGVGVSTNRFRSRSGQVCIDPEDWLRRFPKGYSQLDTLILWQTEDRAVDSFFTPGDDLLGEAYPVTLIQDLPDAPHVLELIAEGDGPLPPVAAIRVYHPQGSPWDTPRSDAGPPWLRVLVSSDEVLAVWSEKTAGWRLFRGGAATRMPWPVPDLLQNGMGIKGARVPMETPLGLFRLENR